MSCLRAGLEVNLGHPNSLLRSSILQFVYINNFLIKKDGY